jgi:hypothetical protein
MDDIFQRKPVRSKPSIFHVKSWTYSVESYCEKAKELTQCILKNRRLMKRPYRWFLTINFEDVMEPALIKSRWKTACDNLRDNGLIAIWVREPSRTNKVHHHLLVKNDISRKELAQIVEKSMPSRKTMRWHKMIKPVKKGWRLAFYLTKAKLSGVVKGQYVEDYYARKRLLFEANLGLKKFGTVGAFWEKPKKELWQEIAAEEKQIADALQQNNVSAYVQHLYDMLDGTVSLKELERSIGSLVARDPSFLAYIEQLALNDFDYWA